MSHNITLSVTPIEDDVEFTEITITITQAGRLGVSRSIAFIIRYTGIYSLCLLYVCALNNKLLVTVSSW